MLITLTRDGHDSPLKIVVDVGPGGVQHAGAVGRMREAGHHGVLFRDDYAVLAPSAIKAISAVGAAPHLITITLIPIVIRMGGNPFVGHAGSFFVLLSDTYSRGGADILSLVRGLP